MSETSETSELTDSAGQTLHILSISGSLRMVSSNTALLNVAAALAPAHIHISRYQALDQLPHFNPDLDTDLNADTAPTSVLDFRHQLQACDGILMCSPEYAHGVPGVLKNALDWIVSSGELMHKPIVLINASPRSTFAQASLTETLTVMMAHVSTVAMPFKISGMDESALLANNEIVQALREAVAILEHAAIASRPGRSAPRHDFRLI